MAQAVIRCGAAVAAAAALLAGCGSAEQTRTAAPSRAVAVAAPPSAVQQIANGPVDLGITGAAARRLPVPILMYHVLGTPAPGTPLPELWVSQERFEEQLAALHRAGFTAVTLDRVWSAWHGDGGLPERPIVLTFDDGYSSHWKVGVPAMRRYGWPGVLYLELNNLGAKGLPRHLATRMVTHDGWEVGSHTMTHPDLPTIGDAQLQTELVESRRQITKIFGVAPDHFCYPAGKYDARVEAAVKAAGYLTATTTEPGVAKSSDDPYAIPRLRITNADTGPALLARIQGAAGVPVQPDGAG